MEHADAAVARLRATFLQGRTRPVRWRRAQLAGIRALLRERERDFLEALRGDLGKPAAEAYLSEVGLAAGEAAHAAKHLRRWMKRERVPTPLVNQPGRSWVVREPLGVVLIIGPWNYPLNLMLMPLVAAVAAGNAAVLKPSEYAPHTSAALARWLPEYLDPECVAVVEGDAGTTQALLANRFDHIFFTGSAGVAQHIMAAAATHLTPVTLELGGKSPCYVGADIDLEVAARRIAWGKFLNAGQTCVAPDYVLVDEAMEARFLAALRDAIGALYGADPGASPDYGRIVNARHFDRLALLLAEGEAVVGGACDREARYIAPTVLTRVPQDGALMAEEIFGPILPVFPVRDVDDAIARIGEKPKPLALYVFSRSREVQRRILESTSSGSVAINEVVSQLAVPELPFGGVGASGMGAYHGRHGFETFSHRKAVLKRPFFLDLALRYPPYTEAKLRWVRRFL